MRPHAFLVHLVALPALGACSASYPDAYRGRDGKAEALADYQHGALLKIYSHIFNGFVPGSRSPGLTECSPSASDGGHPRSRFVFIPEAAFQEGAPTTPAQDASAASAIRFARDYNMTTLRLRKREVQALCPRVRPEI
jgi:hypothetical protein